MQKVRWLVLALLTMAALAAAGCGGDDDDGGGGGGGGGGEAEGKVGVILPDTDLALAKRLGERIRKIICHHVFLRDEGLNERLGASIGVATYPSEAHTKEELIQLADERMYRDKKKNHGLGR